MKQNVVIIVIAVILIGAIVYFILQDSKETGDLRNQSIDSLYAKWNNIATRNNLPSINEEKTKSELNKLPQEDLDWLSGFTEQINSAKSIADYFALAQQYEQFRTIIYKTNLFVDWQKLMQWLDNTIGKFS